MGRGERAEGGGRGRGKGRGGGGGENGADEVAWDISAKLHYLIWSERQITVKTKAPPHPMEEKTCSLKK